MFRGYRGVFAAIAGLGLIVLALGVGAYFGALYSPDKKQYQAVTGNQPGAADYSGPSQSLPDVSGIPGFAERSVANPPPASGEDHEKRDLAAQESMSVWAFWMMIVAAFSAVITTVGTIFLYKQITLTREAVEDTSAATEAMHEANEIAKVALQQSKEMTGVQSRAYVIVEQVVFDLRGHPENTMQVMVHFKNVGQTPALETLQKVKGAVLHYKDPETDLKPVEDDDPPNPGTLAPGQPTTVGFKINVGDEAAQSLIVGGWRYYAHGWFHYKDIFGESHETHFRWFMDSEIRQEGWNAKRCKEGNSFT